MAESNATQVILTDDGMKIIKAQNTADNAAGGVTNLNDPNLMSVIEKQNNIGQFAGLTSQFNVLVQNAKDDGIDTTAATTAYNNLNKFMADILADPNHASDIDRARYKKYQDAYNEELAKLQNALQNNTNDKFTSAASALSQAASTANVAKSAADSTYSYVNSEIAVQSTATAKAQSAADGAFSQAQVVGSQASSEIAVQSNATAKAQSTADSAFSKATTAIDNGKVTSQAVTDLKDGSKLTIAELENGLATKVANSDYASYKEQTASQIGQMVTNGAFSAYQQTTADLISAKVATKDFSAYQATTAKAIDSKVESKDFNTYKTQTAGMIDSKVSNSNYTSDMKQMADQIEDKVSNGTFTSYKTETANLIGSKVSNGDFTTYKTQTAGLISAKVETKDFSAYKDETAKAISSKVESKDFNTYKTQTADMISSKVESKDFQALQTQVQNSAVGTNLLVGTSRDLQTAPDSSGKFAGGLVHKFSQDELQFLAGKQVTLRAFIHNPTDHTVNLVLFTSGSTIPFGVGTDIPAGTDGYSTITAYNISSSVPSGDISIRAYAEDTAISGVQYKELKLEKGSISTDWCLNPTETATQSQITQLSGDINLRVTKDGLIDQINVQAGKTLISSGGQLTLSGKNILLDSNDPVIMKSANIDKLLVGKKLTAADIAANTFTTNNGTFTVDKSGLVTATSLVIRGSTNLVYNAALLGGNGSSIPGWGISNNGYYSNQTLHDGVPSIGYHNNTGAGAWVNFAQSKLYSLNGKTGLPYSASVWFLEVGSDTNLKYQFTLAFFDANGNRLDSGYIGNTWNGIGSRQDWRYVTINNAISPSNAVYVAIQYWAYNGSGYCLFSSPMLTQTAQSTGYQPDTGNIVSAGEIDGSVINGSTINGTTFHGGDIINNANNTAKYYPMTITPDGSYKSTYFDGAVGLQSSVESGAIIYKYRSMIGNGKYLAYDSIINGQGLNLQSGYTSVKDTTFSNRVSTTTGYVIVNANDGITLHGDNQQITFNGTSADVTHKGIIITPYGNINPNGTQNIWYVGNNMNMKTASFGIDGSGANNIQFNRSLDIGNFNINTYHTITSSDNGPIHFNRNNGKSVDIYAATVHYESLSKVSLLSVKKDVKKADTAYWAQLVNSIDLATYQYKSDDNTSHIRLSSIVDDVHDSKQWQLPDVFISRNEDGKLCGVDDSVLLNATLATVQEQQKEIDQLNGHNMELEAKLNKLEVKLNG